jgi:hypothetical protein
LSDRKKNLDVPVLQNLKGSIFDCCATYIQEDYEDLDSLVQAVEEPKKEEFLANLCDEDNETTYDGKLDFTEIITKLSKDRATEYNTWFYVGVSLINLFYRKIITRGQVYDLFDAFSAKADNYSPDGVAKVLDTNFPRFNGKGYFKLG